MRETCKYYIPRILCLFDILLYFLFVIINLKRVTFLLVIPCFKVENSFSLSVSPLIHSWKILRLTWKRRSKLSKWEMAKSKMEYFVGERDLSKDISPLYVHAQRRLVSLRLRWRREFSARRGGEKRSHRKPNTMVIRGWVCFRVTSSIRRRKKIRSPSPPMSSIRQLPGIENLLNSLPRYPPCHLLLCQNSLSLFLSSCQPSLDLIGDRLFDILIIRLFGCHWGWVWFRKSIARRHTKNRRRRTCHPRYVVDGTFMS